MGEFPTSFGCGPTAVPELRLAAMYVDPGIPLRVGKTPSSLACNANETHVVQKKTKKFVNFLEDITNADREGAPNVQEQEGQTEKHCCGTCRCAPFDA